MQVAVLFRVLWWCSLSCHCLYSVSTLREEVLRVHSKQILKSTGELLVVDVDGKSYGLRRNWWLLGHRDPPDWNDIEVDSKGTYLAKIYGLRNPTLGWRPNIVSLIPMQPHNTSTSVSAKRIADILAAGL